MTTEHKHTWLRRTAVASILPFAALGLTGCDTSGTEEGADVEDVVEEDADAGAAVEEETVEPYDGLYDQAFYDEKDTYIGEEVILSADVNEIVSPSSFTIAGTDDTTVEPLLVVSAEEMSEVEPGLTVEVTGIVHEAFDLPTVEEEMDLELEDETFEDWDGQSYVEATNVDTSVAADS